MKFRTIHSKPICIILTALKSANCVLQLAKLQRNHMGREYRNSLRSDCSARKGVLVAVVAYRRTESAQIV